MKNIIILLLLLCVGMPAEENQEKYVPYMMYTPGWVSSAVLMPNGKGFYTFQNGKVGIWGLNPIKLIDSFKIDNNWRSTNLNRESIYVSSDNKRLILHSKYGLLLWDLEQRKLIKKINKGKIRWWLASYSDYGFLTLDYYSQLTLWDDKALTVLKQKQLPRKQEYHKDDYVIYAAMNMLSGKNVLFINYLIEAYFLNLDTFEIVDSLDNNMIQNHIRTEAIKKIRVENKASFDHFKKFDYVSISKSRMVYFNKYKDHFDSAIWETYMKNIWADRTYSTISTYTNSEGTQLALYRLADLTYYTLKMIKNTPKNNKEQYFKIWQSNNDWYVEDENHFFNVSKDARKVLKVKNQEGKILPMNDNIFNQHKKTLNIEI